MSEPQTPPAYDPVELARAYSEIAQRSSQMVSRYMASLGLPWIHHCE